LNDQTTIKYCVPRIPCVEKSVQRKNGIQENGLQESAASESAVSPDGAGRGRCLGKYPSAPYRSGLSLKRIRLPSRVIKSPVCLNFQGAVPPKRANGSEYNSRVFTTIREAFFLLKNGLRKYIHYRPSLRQHEYQTIFPVGGWIDRFAGCHIHVALGKKKFTIRQARLLSRHIHNHIPFIIALTANSPVWRDRVTKIHSNRLLLGTKKYCQVTKRGVLSKHHYNELTYNLGGKRKPPTLELRVLDSGVPEYILAATCVIKAIALRWLKRKPALGTLKELNYLKARDEAVHYGTEATLYWKNHELSVPQYVDLFFRKYEDELDQMDIPGEVLDIFKYLKRGWNQATVIRRATQKARWRHRPTWEKRFTKRYAAAIEALLDGNSYRDFVRRIGIRLPKIDRVWLGRKEARW
jgi:gamma-glutamyl:cysteine ligase YbdK (ATP-grasp superfamily)